MTENELCEMVIDGDPADSDAILKDPVRCPNDAVGKATITDAVGVEREYRLCQEHIDEVEEDK